MTSGGVRGGLEVEVGNDPVVEWSWLQGALRHAHQHIQGLVAGGVPRPPLCRSQQEDDEVYRSFRKALPSFDVRVLQPDDPLWPYIDREYWSPLLRRWSHVVEDPTLLTLVRVDARRPPVGDNAVLVPRLKWVMIELARDREGANAELRLDGSSSGALSLGDDDDEEEGPTAAAADAPPVDKQGRAGGLALRPTGKFWTIERAEEALPRRQQQEPADEEERQVVEQVLRSMGAEHDASTRLLIEEEVRRQAEDLRLVRDSNRAAVQQQAREAAPPEQCVSEAAEALVERWCREQEQQQQPSPPVVGGRPLVLEGALSAEEVAQAREEARRMRDSGLLSWTPQRTSGTRLDAIRWLSEEDLLPTAPGLRKAVLLLKGMAHALARRGLWPEGPSLSVPRQCMLACYPGDGAYYVPHRDNVPRPLLTAAEGGGGGNDREVTCVLYLNHHPTSPPQGHTSGGGALRCYVGASCEDEDGASAVEVVDVEPRGGRMVVFSSRELLHEVRPCQGGEERWALSIWILGTTHQQPPTPPAAGGLTN